MIKKILIIIACLLAGQNAVAAEFTKTFSWNQGGNWYPVVWQAVDEGIHPPSWAASTSYSLGDLVTSIPYPVPGVYYECTRAGTSGATKPDWSFVNDNTFDDPDANGVQWQVHNGGEDFHAWSYGATYRLGDVVIPIKYDDTYGWHFICTTPGKSGNKEPVWQFTDGQLVPGSLVKKPVIVRIFSGDVEIGQGYDNDVPDQRTDLPITWSQPEARSNITATAEWAAGPSWKAGADYNLGDIVVSSAIFGNGYVYFKCTRAGMSGASEPTWSTIDGTVIDDPDANGVQWTVHNVSISLWQPSTAYTLGDKIRPISQKLPGNYVYVCFRAGTSGSTEPDWNAVKKIPWYAFFRYWFSYGTNGTIDDPDENGVQWTLTKRIDDVSVSPALIRVKLENSDDKITPIGRSFN